MSDEHPAPWKWVESGGRRWLVDANGAPVRAGRIIGDQIVDTAASETQRLAPETAALLRWSIGKLGEYLEQEGNWPDVGAGRNEVEDERRLEEARALLARIAKETTC